LAINDLSTDGNQPFISNDGNTILVCNGEIYNYKLLASEYQIDLTSNSDCEIILQLYLKIGFMETIKKLNGIFACVLYDKNTNTISVARDRIGISSLYVGINNNNDFGFCSELKGIDYLFDDIQQFKPGHIWNSINNKYISYLDEPTDLFLTKSLINIDTIKYQIKSKFLK
jgi:asparagine synthase (glutamine-hydrolysing)